MITIKFIDGTPPIEVKVLVKAETVLFCRDKENHFLLIKRSKVDEGDPEEGVEFSEEVDENQIDSEVTGDLIENEKHNLL